VPTLNDVPPLNDVPTLNDVHTLNREHFFVPYLHALISTTLRCLAGNTATIEGPKRAFSPVTFTHMSRKHSSFDAMSADFPY